jgi:hypothetical protein
VALPKPQHHPDDEPVEQEKPFKPLFGPVERLRAIHEDLSGCGRSMRIFCNMLLLKAKMMAGRN